MIGIDTGLARNNPFAFDKVQLLLDAAQDALPGGTQAQIDNHIVQAVIGEMRSPKEAATVRRHFLTYWPLIAPLAGRDPRAFDWIIQELLEALDARS